MFHQITEDNLEKTDNGPLVPNEYIGSKEKVGQFVLSHYGSKDVRRTKFKTNFQQIFTTLVLLVLLGCLIAWGVVVYERMMKSYEQNSKAIHELRLAKIKAKKETPSQTDEQTNSPQAKAQLYTSLLMLPNVTKENKNTEKTNKAQKQQQEREKIIIHVTGDNGMEESYAGKPLHRWKNPPVILNGNISFERGKYIYIKTPGVYLVQAQMFFGNNTRLLQRNKNFILDFSIVNRFRRIASTAVPLTSCKSSCTSSVSNIVKLKRGDFLSVQTLESGQRFFMMKEKVYFGAYRLQI